MSHGRLIFLRSCIFVTTGTSVKFPVGGKGGSKLRREEIRELRKATIARMYCSEQQVAFCRLCRATQTAVNDYTDGLDSLERGNLVHISRASNRFFRSMTRRRHTPCICHGLPRTMYPRHCSSMCSPQSSVTTRIANPTPHSVNAFSFSSSFTHRLSNDNIYSHTFSLGCGEVREVHPACKKHSHLSSLFPFNQRLSKAIRDPSSWGMLPDSMLLLSQRLTNEDRSPSSTGISPAGGRQSQQGKLCIRP